MLGCAGPSWSACQRMSADGRLWGTWCLSPWQALTHSIVRVNGPALPVQASQGVRSIRIGTFGCSPLMARAGHATRTKRRVPDDSVAVKVKSIMKTLLCISETLNSSDPRLSLLLLVNIVVGMPGGTTLPMMFDGRLLTAARILAGLSQSELAAQADCAVSSLARFEQGRTQPRLDTVRALVGALARNGIEFLPESERHYGGVALVRGTWTAGPT